MTQSLYPRPDNNWLIVAGWLVFAVSLIAITAISMLPNSAPPSGRHMDKVLHALAYGVFTGGMIFAWPKRALPIIFLFAFIYGALIELSQGLFAQGRTASVADAVANGVGALLTLMGWIVVYLIFRRYLASSDL